MPFLFTNGKFRAANDDNTPLVGGLLYTYVSGTTTPKASYQDSGLLTPNANPVVLDSRGEASVWPGAGAYTLTLKRSDGTLVWSVDGVRDPTDVATSLQTALADTSSSANGAALVGFLPALSGAVGRLLPSKLLDFVSVKDFGAKGDGSTDDTAAFQAAINYCQSNLKTLYIPGNNSSQYYKLTSTLNVTAPLKIQGDGSSQVTLITSGLSVGQFALNIDGTAYGTFGNAEFAGFAIRAGAGDCIQVKNASSSIFRDIALSNCRNGMVITGTRCFSNHFERVVATAAGGAITGLNVLYQSFNGGGQHTWLACSLGGPTGLSLDSASFINNLDLIGTNFESNSANCMTLSGTVLGLKMSGCRNETCGGVDAFVIQPTAGNKVVGLSCTGGSFNRGSETNLFNLGGGGGVVRGFEITGNHTSHPNIVKLNGDGESGTVANNYSTVSGATATDVRRANVAIYNNENGSGKMPGSMVLVEGTITPTDASGAGLTLTGSGFYTRIGRTVFWQALVVYPTTADATAALVGGLPFSVAAGGSSQGRAGAFVSASNSANAVGLLQIGTTVKVFKASEVAATNADLSGKEIYIGGFFTTTDA